MLRRHLVAGLVSIWSLAAVFGTAAAATIETKEPIKVLMINSSDADFIAAIYGEVLKEAGYRVKYVQADYVASYAAVTSGDIDVSLAAWQTTGGELTRTALASGTVTGFGPTGVKVTEGWWYSRATKDACPGLPDWKALKAPSCMKALATAETAPKGRYLDAPADWLTFADKVIPQLGLNLERINSGSPAVLVASVKGAIDRQEPILAWGFLPHWLFSKAGGDFVELPDFHRDRDILKLAYTPTVQKAKIAATILKAYTVSSDDVAVAMDEIDNGGKKPEDAAREWMVSHEDTWRSWLPR